MIRSNVLGITSGAPRFPPAESTSRGAPSAWMPGLGVSVQAGVHQEIGRASWRGRVLISVVAV